MLVITRWYSFLGDVELHRAPLLQPTASNSYFSDGSWHSRKHSTSKQNRLRSDFYFGTKHMGNASWNSKPQQQDAFPKSQWDVWNQPIPSLGWKMLKVLKEILKFWRKFWRKPWNCAPKIQRNAAAPSPHPPTASTWEGLPSVCPWELPEITPKHYNFHQFSWGNFGTVMILSFCFFRPNPRKNQKSLKLGETKTNARDELKANILWDPCFQMRKAFLPALHMWSPRIIKIEF